MVGEAQEQAPQRDVSHKTLIVLVILTVLISLLSTWTVLNEVSNAKFAKVTEGKSVGEVKLTVVNPGETAPAAPTPGMGATGQVAFNVITNSEEP